MCSRTFTGRETVSRPASRQCVRAGHTISESYSNGRSRCGFPASAKISKYSTFVFVLLLSLLATLAPRSVLADVDYVVNGVDDPLKRNILSYVDGLKIGQRQRLSNRALESVLDDAVEQATVALRPYGYYNPTINGRYLRQADGSATIELNVDRGRPMVIRALSIEVTGPGADRRELILWREGWPLEVGQTLNQVIWDERKLDGLETARSTGYLSAEYTEHVLELDLEANTVDARLVLNTGERFVMGEVNYGDHVLAPGVVENLARFETGDPYSIRVMDDFRVDLWQSGYFTDVDVREVPHPDSTPPRVDLVVDLATESRNFYQGAIGFGSDTGVRVQANYNRHPMSKIGDRLDVGIGWQELDDEFRLVGVYRRPRRNKRRQFWVTEGTIRFENQDLEFKRDDSSEDFLRFANGDLEERHIRFGRLKVHNREGGEQQRFVTPFVQYLSSERRFALLEPTATPALPGSESAFDRLLSGTDNVLSLGVDVDVVSVVGRQFQVRGRRDRDWAFFGNSAFGNDFDFAQLYLSTRRSYLYGSRFKLLLRAEAGYTESQVDDVTINAPDGPLSLSVTRLPNFYRFRAGGSTSVRGYGFEQLSNNNVGSNNIFTASAELETRFLSNWSAAVFADIGNAFNDWNDPDLKLGLGLGIRWYSIAGPIRIDIARAMDFDGKPWRLHFTIGTPLL